MLEKIWKRGCHKNHLGKMSKRKAENYLFKKDYLMQELDVAKLNYHKIWISNYLLLFGLCMIVAGVCITTSSHWIFLSSLFCYFCLIVFHHEQRIKKDEDWRSLTVTDYELTTMAMKFCAMGGIVVAAAFSLGAFIL